MAGGHGPVLVLHEADTAYEELEGTGLELARVLTAAGTTGLGGGYAKWATDGELADWTLPYDEVFFVLEGSLTVRSKDTTVRAGPGEIVLIPKGSTVTYQGVAGTKAFFVLHPRDWAEHAPAATGGGREGAPT